MFTRASKGLSVSQAQTRRRLGWLGAGVFTAAALLGPAVGQTLAHSQTGGDETCSVTLTTTTVDKAGYDENQKPQCDETTSTTTRTTTTDQTTTDETTTDQTTTDETTTDQTTTDETTTDETTTDETSTTTTNETSTTTTPPSGEVKGETGTPKPTLPPTSTVGSDSSSNSGSISLGLLLLALGSLGLVLVSPSAKKNRR